MVNKKIIIKIIKIVNKIIILVVIKIINNNKIKI